MHNEAGANYRLQPPQSSFFTQLFVGQPFHTHTHTHKLVPGLMHHNTRIVICYLRTPQAVGIYNYTPLGDLNEG